MGPCRNIKWSSFSFMSIDSDLDLPSESTEGEGDGEPVGGVFVFDLVDEVVLEGLDDEVFVVYEEDILGNGNGLVAVVNGGGGVEKFAGSQVAIFAPQEFNGCPENIEAQRDCAQEIRNAGLRLPKWREEGSKHQSREQHGVKQAFAGGTLSTVTGMGWHYESSSAIIFTIRPCYSHEVRELPSKQDAEEYPPKSGGLTSRRHPTDERW